MRNNGNLTKDDGVDLKDLFNSQIENIRTLINANDKNYNQRFDNVIEATKSALAAADRAVNKAEQATEKRFEGVNEFRNTLSDQQRTFVPRAEIEILIKSINEKIEDLEESALTMRSQSAGIKEGAGMVALIAGVVATLIGVLFRFL